MRYSEILRSSWRSVRANALRSGLTLTIIAVGLMALVGILTALDCALYSLSDSFSSLGANSFSIDRKLETVKGQRRGRPQKMGEPVNFQQANEFKERFDYPAKVSLNVGVSGAATVKRGEKKSNPNVVVMGTDEYYLAIKGLDLGLGRNFSETELQIGAAKAIVGADIVKILFDNQPSKAVGQVFFVGNLRYEIIGVLATKGASSQNNDRQILVPLLNAKKTFDIANSDYGIAVAVNSASDMEAASDVAMGLMRQVRRLRVGEEDDFEIFKSDGLLDILKDNTVTLRSATIGIGLITLFGAAIGLMNIMLVSVTERTREIGISKALGATKRIILMQFLTEAVLICQMGGVVGIVLGILMGNLVSLLLGGQFLMPWAWIILGLITCFVVGIVAGLYPASRAANLDPIESLRYE